MKRLRFRAVTLFLVVCMILGPLRLQAQQPEEKPSKADIINQARFDAEKDADMDANKFLWLGCGFVTLWMGMAAAYFIVPSPSAERLMGKSADYVFAYTTMYRSKRRSTQTTFATIGCAISGTIATIALLIALENDEVECCSGPDLSCGLSDEMDDCNATSENCSNTSENCSGD
jgi:hypothetical protein